MRLRGFIYAALITFALSTPASAVDVFGNGNRSTNDNLGGYSYNSNDAWAVPISPGTSTADQRNLLGAWILSGGNTTEAITVEVSIFADAGTNAGPTGSALASGTINLPSGSGKEWRFVTFAAPYSLTSGSHYYLSVASSSSTTAFVWAIPNSFSYTDLGSGSDYSITTGGVANIYKLVGSTWSTAGFDVATAPFGFQITSVPEPSTYALAGISALTIGFVARRRKTA